MKFTTHVLILILATFSFVLHAQERSISGTVISAEDGRYLEGVNVLIS